MEEYWVQIEYEPTGDSTGAIQLDLSRVKQVKIERKGGKLSAVAYNYDGNANLIRVENAGWASSFLTEWNIYLSKKGGLQHCDEEAKPGLIAIPDNGRPKNPSLSAIRN